MLSSIRSLLADYYDQEARPDSPGPLLAPIVEADKAAAAKDPDTLFEAAASLVDYASTDSSPACHAAGTSAAFIDCTGARLALVKGVSYRGGLTFFLPDDYYFNDDTVQLAGQFALYHAFARDFDAPRTEPYTPTSGREPRDFKRYHERMIQAYEAHMRALLVAMFTEARGDAAFQLSFTRSVGWLLAPYVRTVQALEEYRAWGSPADRAAAIALVNGLSQRIWWEWVVPQPNGPRTAGKAALGSQATFDAALAADPRMAGTDRFPSFGKMTPSLRTAAAAAGHDALWFDADYAMPGEVNCHSSFRPAFGPNWQRCMDLAKRAGLDGTNSPFGTYFGTDASCTRRASGPTRFHCGETNLGSMAEEWLGTYVGARAGMRLLDLVGAARDPALPPGALGAGNYRVVTDRLGYGVAGFHGGEGRQDDLEWTFEQPPGQVVSIRTLSGARHDGEPQNGRFSLGEQDLVAGRRGGAGGDTWLELGGQEFPGAMENHVPGPNPLYGALIGQMVLGDKVDGGMSPSLFNAAHRNHPDEFQTWLWLLQATFYRCQGVDDPADPRCMAFSRPPGGPGRVALFHDPWDGTEPEPMRYAWRDRALAVDDRLVAEADRLCGRSKGLLFGQMPVNEGVAGRYLLADNGYGAYNLLLQLGGAYMRLAAARYTEPAPDGALEGEYLRQREEELAPWYREMERLIGGILRLYGPDGLGYVPDIENAPCARGTGADTAPLTRRAATGMSPEVTIALRARWYTAAAAWYWWYDSDWLDVDSQVWGDAR